jgi:hypothetical protein
MARLKQLRGAQERKKTMDTMMSMELVLRLRLSWRSLVWLDRARSTRFEVPLKDRHTLENCMDIILIIHLSVFATEINS